MNAGSVANIARIPELNRRILFTFATLKSLLKGSNQLLNRMKPAKAPENEKLKLLQNQRVATAERTRLRPWKKRKPLS